MEASEEEGPAAKVPSHGHFFLDICFRYEWVVEAEAAARVRARAEQGLTDSQGGSLADAAGHPAEAAAPLLPDATPDADAAAIAAARGVRRASGFLGAGLLIPHGGALAPVPGSLPASRRPSVAPTARLPGAVSGTPSGDGSQPRSGPRAQLGEARGGGGASDTGTGAESEAALSHAERAVKMCAVLSRREVLALAAAAPKLLTRRELQVSAQTHHPPRAPGQRPTSSPAASSRSAHSGDPSEATRF